MNRSTLFSLGLAGVAALASVAGVIDPVGARGVTISDADGYNEQMGGGKNLR